MAMNQFVAAELIMKDDGGGAVWASSDTMCGM